MKKPVVKNPTAPFIENTAEATAACLIAMVQGNILALTFSHWLIASQTGVLAGLVTTTAIVLSRVKRPWIISTVLGVATAIVDYFVHPGMLGPFFLEAIATGLGAGVLSYVAQLLIRALRFRTRKARATDAAGSNKPSDTAG